MNLGEAPPWLHVLTPAQRAWREKHISVGRDPDAQIEKSLIETGLWKPREKSEGTPP